MPTASDPTTDLPIPAPSADLASGPVPAGDVPQIVDALLDRAAQQRASDLHLEPTAQGYDVRLRIDGLLQTIAHHDAEQGRALVIRMMVMAGLLTYRLDVPQEGKFAALIPALHRGIEMRLSIMPTTHGLRAAVRLPADLIQPRTLDDLGLPARTLDGLRAFAAADSGLLLLAGPAGSGKTTTIYALLEYIVATSPGLSIISLEDPVERDIAGVTQIEVAPFGQLTYERVLRSMLRQDPQVLVLGEIRDSATAAIALQAALTGHRLISTLHAGSPGTAVIRLLEMGLEPYQIASSLFGVAALRLVRRKDGSEDAAASTEGARYRGRVPVAAWARLDDPLRALILARASAQAIDEHLVRRPDYQTLGAAAADLVRRGLTDDAEVHRVLGHPLVVTP
jgi:type II secretory ATPase GspE/PulE/Tfp pilus assembly ATPase PilB-like protein